MALDGMALEALQNVVLKIVKGTMGHDIKFCPRPPELASMVRKEERLLYLMRTPKSQNDPLQKPTMVALMDKKWEGKRIIAKDVDIKSFRAREWPMGSIYVPILSTVFEGT